jgi:tetratricopeptide (TPR) repeat protein
MRDDQSGTIEWPDGGFPGIRINPDTLLSEVVSEEACAAALEESTDPADRVLVLLVEGRASDAAELVAEARYKDPESFTLRAYEADVLRVSHRYDRAIELFRQLLTEAHGTANEALAYQYLGRMYFVAGNIAAAVESFTRALDLRVAQSADAALIYSSTVALARARDVFELAS